MTPELLAEEVEALFLNVPDETTGRITLKLEDSDQTNINNVVDGVVSLNLSRLDMDAVNENAFIHRPTVKQVINEDGTKTRTTTTDYFHRSAILGDITSGAGPSDYTVIIYPNGASNAGISITNVSDKNGATGLSNWQTIIRYFQYRVHAIQTFAADNSLRATSTLITILDIQHVFTS